MQTPNQAPQRRQEILNKLAKGLKQQNLEIMMENEQPFISLPQQEFLNSQFSTDIARIYDLLLQQLSLFKFSSKNNPKLHLPSSFRLEIDVDFITQAPIQNPMICLSNDCMMMNPKFCDFSTFLDYLLVQENANFKIDPNDVELMLLFWKMKTFLEKSNSNKKYNIYIYPNNANFVITEASTQVPYFFDQDHFQTFLQQNSAFLNKNKNLQYFESLEQQIGIEAFQIFNTEEIQSKSKYVYLAEIKDFDKELINSRLKKLNITEKQFSVKPKPFDFIHSTLCRPEKVVDYVQHKILFPKGKLPFCSHCGIKIDPDEFDTLFYDRGFKNSYETLVQITMIDQSILPVVFYLPIYYKFIRDKTYGNIFIQFYTDKNIQPYPEEKKIYIFYQQGYKIMHYNFSQEKNWQSLQNKNSEPQNLKKNNQNSISEIQDQFNQLEQTDLTTEISEIQEQPNQSGTTEDVFFNHQEELEDN